MSAWEAKRFWKAVRVVALDDGFTVELDSRPVRTPGKALLLVPTEEMAKAIAAEWDAQVGKIDPTTMPFTRGANSAIDKVAVQKDEVVAMLAAYGDSDLLCYRAHAPEELVSQQRRAWDPLIDWAATSLDAPLVSAEGVMHVPQNPAALARLHTEVARMTPFQLTGFHDLVAISGSLILALAVVRGRLTPDEAWTLSRVDEDYQISQWGDDEEASALAQTKRRDFVQGAKFYTASLT